MVYAPTRFARSLWAPGTLNGPAVCALAARAAEHDHSVPGFRPARFTIDLFKVAREVPTFTRGRLIRDGGRIKVAETDVLQYDDQGAEVSVARSTTVFVRESTNPPGERWTRPASTIDFRPPPAAHDDPLPWFGSETPDDDGTNQTAWDQDMGRHQDGRRKRLWTRAVATVAGEEPSPFERSVISGESTSLVCNWGDTGIGFINCDLTVALSRLPVGTRIGVEADTHIEIDGISTSTTCLYDTEGMFGVGMVTGVDNAAAEIDFTKVDRSGRYSEA
ncbi:acyl-CoA thioesterase domain-containing protein [Gordonia sp. CPCC 206044]